jgi:hypothetical protein
MMCGNGGNIQFVMAGLDPAIHEKMAWMPGARPGMTVGVVRE